MLLNRSDVERYLAEGYYFSGKNFFGADLSGLDLSDENFIEANLSCANLSNANLSNADLTNAGLNFANLAGADLSNAELERCSLSGANLTGAKLPNLPIPRVENLDKKILEAVEARPGALDMAGWHYIDDNPCNTTHCRAGFAIHFAGEAGYALEKILGPDAAGALIYHVSEGYVPDFYADTDEALADIRRRASASESV